jgi:hypothetical protein
VVTSEELAFVAGLRASEHQSGHEKDGHLAQEIRCREHGELDPAQDGDGDAAG